MPVAGKESYLTGNRFRFSDSLFSGDCLFHLKVEMGLFPR